MKSTETLPLLNSSNLQDKVSSKQSKQLKQPHQYVSIQSKQQKPGMTYTTSTENGRLSEATSMCFGFMLVAFSALCFATGLTTSRYLQVHNLLTSAQVGYLISFSLLLFSSAYLAVESSQHSIAFNLSQKTLLWLVIRGLMGAVTMICLVYSLHYIPMGDSDAIYYLSPALTIFLSRPLLGEPISYADTVAAFLGFTGAFIVACPNSHDTMSSISTSHRVVGSAFAFGAALSNSIVMVAVRAVVSKTHFMLSIWSLAISGTVLTFFLGGAISLSTLWNNHFLATLCFVVGFFIFVAQMAYNYGFRYCSASTGSVIRNLEIPLSYLLSLVMLHDPVSIVRLLGASLVLLGSAIVPVHKLLQIRKARAFSSYV